MSNTEGVQLPLVLTVYCELMLDQVLYPGYKMADNQLPCGIMGTVLSHFLAHAPISEHAPLLGKPEVCCSIYNKGVLAIVDYFSKMQCFGCRCMRQKVQQHSNI